jgi:hypothetical protein
MVTKEEEDNEKKKKKTKGKIEKSHHSIKHSIMLEKDPKKEKKGGCC